MSCIYEFRDGSTSIFKFFGMSPAPQRPKVRHTFLSRYGVKDHGIYLDASRGEQFTLITEADSENITTAEDLAADYDDKVGWILDVVYQDITYGRYFLLDVSYDVIEVIQSVGGVNHNDSKAVVTAEWLLIPLLPYTPQP